MAQYSVSQHRKIIVYVYPLLDVTVVGRPVLHPATEYINRVAHMFQYSNFKSFDNSISIPLVSHVVIYILNIMHFR